MRETKGMTNPAFPMKDQLIERSTIRQRRYLTHHQRTWAVRMGLMRMKAQASARTKER
jgi:hypothetical protein